MVVTSELESLMKSNSTVTLSSAMVRISFCMVMRGSLRRTMPPAATEAAPSSAWRAAVKTTSGITAVGIVRLRGFVRIIPFCELYFGVIEMVRGGSG